MDENIIEAEFTEEMQQPTSTDIEQIIVLSPAPDQEESENAPQRLLIWPLVVIGLIALTIGACSSFLLYPLFFQRTTITLYPTHYTVSRTVVFTDAQIPLRTLRQSETQIKTVATTGIVTRPATAAQGTLVFYNSSLMAQTIAAGTLLTASNGVEVVTDETVTIAGATPPTEASARIHAHTVTTGSSSNLFPDAIAGKCCKENIFAYNNAFVGGADPTTYHTATATDVEHLTTLLKASLNQKVQSNVDAQVAPGEILLPLQCSADTKNSVPIGGAAETLTITETENCTAKAYQRSDLQTKSSGYLTTEAQKLYGDLYTSKDIQTRITDTANNKITILISGNFSYHLSSADEQKLKYRLAGKKRKEAQLLLLNMQGITKVQIIGQDVLPDAKRIDIQMQT